MRETFDTELQKFTDNLYRLGNAANESVHRAMQAYNNNDKELAHEVVADDLRINALTVDIEQEAYRLIVLQQPVAQDLRKIFTVLQASSDIERLADHAASISKQIIRRKGTQHDQVEDIDSLINEMGQHVTEMISEVLEAYRNEDVQAAREIAHKDRQVDEILKQVYKLVSSHMKEDTSLVGVGISYIGIANSLERIGDYVTNICERILYLHSGDIVELN
ncbi:phosphate signaling complex protein PhoU [Hutsoniella sourekii]|uniref:phosphate signaling complex protein PhoU n=1 Tax=Hutsoniella sourekii TaxID=87650 RepID=UPI000480AD0F|nr:phosphate signaling complex protein PhoU [Hutsoniella sourekii]